MTRLRSYDDPCGIARALDIVGDRWALLVVRELVFGPRRFSDLKTALHMSQNVLSQRLDELEQSGVVRRSHADGTSSYELTAWGHELHPILLQLGRWGARSSRRPAGTLGSNALMLALEATFVPTRAQDLDVTIELHFGDERFRVCVSSGNLAIALGAAQSPDAVIECEPETLRRLVFGDVKQSQAAVVIHGDRARAKAFFKLFKRPR